MTAIRVTRDFLDWLQARGMPYSESPPVAWGQIVLYEHEREQGLWPPNCNCIGDCECHGGCFAAAGTALPCHQDPGVAAVVDTERTQE